MAGSLSLGCGRGRLAEAQSSQGARVFEYVLVLVVYDWLAPLVSGRTSRLLLKLPPVGFGTGVEAFVPVETLFTRT